MQFKNNIDAFLANHPETCDFAKRLNERSVRWAIFAGASVSLLTASREPTDLDIIVHCKSI